MPSWWSPGDMAVRMRKVLARPWVGVRVCHLLLLLLFKNCWTAPWKFPEWVYRRVRIISRTRSRATQESSEEIYRRFQFVNSSEAFQHLSGFQETHWENGKNIIIWTKLCLQKIVTQKKTHPRKNLLRLHYSVFWPASGRKSRWSTTACQKTANHKFCFPTNHRKKNRIWFLNIWSDK